MKKFNFFSIHNLFLCPPCDPLWVCAFLAQTWVLFLCPSFPPLLGALFNKIYQFFVITELNYSRS